MKAKIIEDGFDKEESAKLEPFLGIANFFAKRWNKALLLDAPHGSVQSFDTKDEAQCVHVHFFSAPEESDELPEATSYAREFFYFFLPCEDLFIRGSGPTAMVSGNDVGSRFKSRPLFQNKTFRSPEGLGIAQVVNNHIYILFDIAHKPWDGAEPVFWEVLEWASDFFRDEKTNESMEFSRLLSVCDKMRAETLERKDKFFPDFREVSLLRLHRERDVVSEQLAMEKEKMDGCEKELLEDSLNLERIKDLLDDLENKEPPDLSEEFDLIHRYDGFLGLRIINNEELQIFTKPIEHTSQMGNKRMLSQFQIVIYPSNQKRDGNTFHGIKISEWGWRGPYRHPEMANFPESRDFHAPCFGSQFVNSIAKAFIDQDFRVLIALLLHYLDRDGREANQREYYKKSPEIYKEEPFYASDEEKQKTRSAYITFVNRFKMLLREEELKKDFAAAEKRIERIEELWIEARRKIMLLAYREKFLSDYIGKLPFEKELEKILEIPSLINARIGRDSLWLVFGPGHGCENYADSWFSGTLRVAIHILSEKMVFSGDKDSFCEIALRDIYGANNHCISFREPPVSFGAFRHLLPSVLLFETGCFGQAISSIYEILRGKSLDFKKNNGSVEEILEAKKKEIEEYLTTHLFSEI